jgi:hypothetical protein
MREGCTLIDMEECLDCLKAPPVKKIFFAEIKERRDDLVKSLIEKGEDEFRFKIQAFDEVLQFEEELYAEWKSEKQSAKE